MSSKAQKRAQKKDTKEPVAEEPKVQQVAKPSMLVDCAKTLIKDSFLFECAPKLLQILKAEDGILSGDANKLLASPSKEAKKNDENEASEEKDGKDETEQESNEATTAANATDESVQLFKAMRSRLVWHNALALAVPATSADSKTMWTALKTLEVDYGPRPSKRGSPKMDRIVTNLYNNLSQYLHVLLFVFMLNCFLFRSWFACLPWLFVYQALSLALPLETIEKLPQVPLCKVPLKFRLAGTMTVHALVWLFFLYEAIWKCNFLIELWAIGLIAAHALCVVPGSLTN